MRKLSYYQKEFILEYFFKNEKYSGWKNIGTKLLEKGECIVAGKDCIWIGGIGNFIKTEKNKELIDCSLYKFDLENFFNSIWYKETRDIYVSILESKKLKIEKEYKEISNI